MSRCPNCGRELTSDDERRKVCSQCQADLSVAATVELNSPDATIDFSATRKPADTPPPAAQQTIDLAASASEIVTIGFDASSKGVDGPNKEGGADAGTPDQDPSSTVELAMAAGGRSPDATVDRPDNATVDLPAASTDPLDVELIQQTWQGADASQSPLATIKPSMSTPATSTSTLVVRGRNVRPANTEDVTTADYDLIEQLGEGGMGVVYTARQASIDRTVAVKMLKPRMAQDEGQKQKFLSEAVVTGELDHPNIVPIYELGRNSDGSLFYSMKKIQGTPWMDVLPRKSLAENLEILMKVADAVAFAHFRGVVHRDLKPENIMLGEFGEVLVLDWGLAMPTTDCRKSVHLTGTVGMGGTPSYMAPEMVLGPVETIGKHSDVYLLGAILFECVTGTPPHEGRTAMQCLFAAGKNEIRETTQRGELIDIALKAMSTDPAARFASVQEFQQAVRSYQSHSESISLATRAAQDLEQAKLQDDYQQFARALYVFEEAYELWPENAQARLGVTQAQLAYAESAYRKGDYDLGLSIVDADAPNICDLPQSSNKDKSIATRDNNGCATRNARIGGLAALVFIAVTAGMLLFLIQKQEADRQRAMAVANESEANRQRDEASRQRDEADHQRTLAQQNESAAKQQQQIAITQRSRAERSKQDAIDKRQLAEYEAYIAWIGLADSKIKENAIGQARSVLEQCTADLRNWEWYRLMFQCRQGLSRIAIGQRLDCVAISRDGHSVAAGSRDGGVRVWDLRDGQLQHELHLPNSFATSIDFSPTQPQLLAIAGGTPGKLLQLWDLASGDVRVVPIEHTDRITSVVFSPDGKRLLTASLDNTAVVWDLAEQRAAHVLRGHSWWVWTAQYSRDGRQIVTAGQDGTVRIWDASSGEQRQNSKNEPMPFRAPSGASVCRQFFSRRAIRCERRLRWSHSVLASDRPAGLRFRQSRTRSSTNNAIAARLAGTRRRDQPYCL